jgi:sigma-E factor negative regulatory protein RseA
MVNKMADKEKLSALMDGELVDKAFISQLSQDSESQQTWRHFHLIGDVMRGDVPEKEWDIAQRVALALEDEAPHSLFSSSTDSENQVLPLESQPSPQKAKRSLPAWLSHLGQISIAASVCLAVVLGIQQTGMQSDSPESQAIPVLQTVPLAGVASPVSLTRESVQPQATAAQTQDVQEQRRRINALLQDYELQLRLNSHTNSELVNH